MNKLQTRMQLWKRRNGWNIDCGGYHLATLYNIASDTVSFAVARSAIRTEISFAHTTVG
jgi:hypothetical protein